jgi:thiol:disulfide interchange protein
MTTPRYIWVLVAGTALLEHFAVADNAPAKPAPTKSVATVSWQPSWEAAQNVSRRTGKPIFVYFHAAWCGPCRALDKTVWSDTRVIRVSRAWVPFKADLDSQSDLATRFEVVAPPMVVFLDNKTKKTGSLLGYNDAPTMSKALEGALKAQRK